MISFPSLFLILLLHALRSNAAPLIAEKRAIDATLLQTLRLMSQYASAAYCSNNTNSPGDLVKCSSGTCPLVEQAAPKTVSEYSKTDTSTDVTGFVALDHTNKAIVVSFRGSRSLDNWLTNLDFELVDTDLCSGCTAHAGFWQSWLDARGTVVPAVQAAVGKYPGYAVSATGHSLGGAVATFAAAALRKQGLGVGVSLYTFGSPRVGGAVTSLYISAQDGGRGNYRVTHWNDPVPRVPLLVMGYVHVNPEYYIAVENKRLVTPEDVKVFPRPGILQGNTKWLLTDVEAHRWYFTQMYTCADSKLKRGVQELQGLDVVARF